MPCVDPAVGHGVFHGTIVLVDACSRGIGSGSPAAGCRDKSRHLLGDHVPKLELPQSRCVHYVAAGQGQQPGHGRRVLPFWVSASDLPNLRGRADG